ncbi:hypothetical protein AB6N01_02840 [Alcaligenes nematophilus]|uniref:hypothetical protein n=1 Tax=Alcaligenes nematophilus TaxID=2994643 RepID=UPI0034E0B23A
MFECKITQQGLVHQVSISPTLPEHTYALYVFARTTAKNKFTRVATYWYQDTASFAFEADSAHSDLRFQYFIKNPNGDLICNQNTNIIKKARPALSPQNLGFSESMEADVINDYCVPIKYTRLKDDRRHYIFFNGALSQSTIALHPIFHRHSWAKRINTNTLNIYDASVNPLKGYFLGWYQGTHDRPLHNDIVAIVEQLKRQHGLSNSDLVFYGSSGGGWAALRYASLFKGSLAVAVNAQIEILNFCFPKEVQKFIENCYPGLTKEDVTAKFSDELSINPLMFSPSQDAESSRFILVQNIVDTPHYEDHFLPFWSKFSSNMSGGWDKDKHNYSIVYDHPSGHAGEPDDVFLTIQDAILRMTTNTESGSLSSSV